MSALQEWFPCPALLLSPPTRSLSLSSSVSSCVMHQEGVPSRLPSNACAASDMQRVETYAGGGVRHAGREGMRRVDSAELGVSYFGSVYSCSAGA